MTRLRALWHRLGDWWLRGPRERDLAAEIDAHLALHTDENIRAGMDAASARRHALLSLGGVEGMKDRYRDRRGLPGIDSVLQDVRFGWRMLMRNPGFSTVAFAALTIGIGANVVIFSLVNALLLRPLPIANPDDVVRAYSFVRANTPYPEYVEYRDNNRTLASLAAFQAASMRLRVDGTPEHVFGMVVSGNYFESLGVGAARGRMINPADDRAGAPGAVVVSDRFWRRRFASAPDIVGRMVVLNGQSYAVVGVAAPAFTGTMAPYVPDMWTPWNGPGMLPPATTPGAPDGRSLHMIGRLKPGATLAQAQADLAALASGIGERSPDTRRNLTVTVSRARTLVDEFRGPATAFVGLLTAVVGLVLLIACVNIANLMLARSAARRRELGVRLALGAGQARLVRQLLTESGLLAACGTAAGCAAAFVAVRVLSTVELPAPIPLHLELSFDWRTAAFAVAATVLTTLLFGLMPARHAARTGAMASLRNDGSGVGRRRSRLRSMLITAQVALSTLLLVIGAVLARGMATAHAIDRGLVGAEVLTASVDLEAGGYTPERGRVFLADVLDRLNQTPGVVSSNIAYIVPLTLSNSQTRFFREGDGAEARQRPLVYLNQVTPGHFATLGIPLLAGRDFVAADRAGAPQVAIVNETLARLFWPGEDPIGKRLRMGEASDGPEPWLEVVGVARNSKYVTVGEDPAPFLYRTLAQDYQSAVTVLVKTHGDPTAVLPGLRAAVREVDPELPLYNVSPLDTVTAVSLLPVQVAAVVAGSLGVVGLVLATIGLYGVMSYIVRQRTKEIGMRIALGARPVDVIRVMTWEGMRWTTVGLAVGLAVAWVVTRLLTVLLYGVQATDVVAFAGIALVLTATAFAACYVPARRASRVDPLVALRHE